MNQTKAIKAMPHYSILGIELDLVLLSGCIFRSTLKLVQYFVQNTQQGLCGTLSDLSFFSDPEPN